MSTVSLIHAVKANNMKTARPSLLKNFMHWCTRQQENRLLWLGIALTAHGCIITPLTLMVIMLAGSYLALFIFVLVAMGANLVVNLAALPTKITIPLFLFSLFIDLIVIVLCSIYGFSLSHTS